MTQANSIIVRENTVVGFGLNGGVLQQKHTLATGGATDESNNVFGTPRRYHGLVFDFKIDGIKATRTDFANILNIRLEAVMIDGSKKLIRDFENGKELWDWNTTKAIHTANGFLTMAFTSVNAKTDVEQGVSALGTADVKKLVLSVSLKAGLTNPVCELVEIYDEINEPMGIIDVVSKGSVDFAGAGENKITHLQEDLLGQGMLRSVVAMTNKITHLSIEKDVELYSDVDSDTTKYIHGLFNKSQPNKVLYDQTNDVFARDFAGDSALGGIPMIGGTVELAFTTTGKTASNVYYEFRQGTDQARNQLVNTLSK